MREGRSLRKYSEKLLREIRFIFFLGSFYFCNII